MLAWRLDLAHVEPVSTVSFASGGNPRYAPGVPVFLRAVSGHRDTGFTDCPGRALYALLGDITGDVAELGLPKLYAPVVTGAVPATCDSARGCRPRSTGRSTSPTVAAERVASTAGYGQAIDWTWPAAGLSAGRYSYAIRAPDVTPAVGTLGGGSAPEADAHRLRARSATRDAHAERRRRGRCDDGRIHALGAGGRDGDRAATRLARTSCGCRALAPGGRARGADRRSRPSRRRLPRRDRGAGRPAAASHRGSVQVDGDAHARRLAADRGAFSPNGDGRADRVAFSLPAAGACGGARARAARRQVGGDALLRAARAGRPPGRLDRGQAVRAGPERRVRGGRRGDGRLHDGLARGSVRARHGRAEDPDRAACAAEGLGSEPVRLSLRIGARSFKRDVAAAGESRVSAPRLGLVRIVAWDAAGNASSPVSRR